MSRITHRITRWAIRTVALWAIAKGLEMANHKLKQRQHARKQRERAAAAAALPRVHSRPDTPLH